MHARLLHVPRARLRPHRLAAGAYDCFLILPKLEPFGGPALVIEDKDENGRLLYAMINNFAYLTSGADEIPIGVLDHTPSDLDIQKTAWQDLRALLESRRMTPDTCHQLIATIAQNCPDDLRPSFRLKANKDSTALRRYLGLRPPKFTSGRNPFERAKRRIIPQQEAQDETPHSSLG